MSSHYNLMSATPPPIQGSFFDFDDEVADSPTVPSHFYPLFSLPGIPVGRRSPSSSTISAKYMKRPKTSSSIKAKKFALSEKANALSNAPPSSTQDLADFIRTSGPQDYWSLRKRFITPFLRSTYKKAMALVAPKPEPVVPTLTSTTTKVKARKTSNGSRYLQIQVTTPCTPPTSEPSSPTSQTTCSGSMQGVQLSPAPWLKSSENIPSYGQVTPPPRPRSYSMEAVGGRRVATYSPRTSSDTVLSSPRRRRTPPPPGPPPSRSLPALPESPPYQPTPREQSVRMKKSRDMAAARAAREEAARKEAEEVERRLKDLERKNEVLENALVGLIRGTVLGDPTENNYPEENKLCVQPFLRELLKAGP